MIERFYKPDSNFVYIKITGHLHENEGTEHILSYVNETTGQNELLELCDIRNAVLNKLTVQNSIDTGKSHYYLLNSVKRIAFLVSDELQCGHTRAFIAFAAKSQTKIEVFYDLDDALHFLNPAESISEVIDFIKAHA